MIAARFFKPLLAILCAIALSASPALAWDKDSLSQLQPLAQEGNAEAQYFVGMLLSLGIGGASRDTKAAFDWFEKSAAGKDPLGAYKVGCYYAGQYPDAVAFDADKALSFKLIAAEAGYALAQSDVANIYYRLGDPEKAKAWWIKAAGQGFPPAAHTLSIFHLEGKDGTTDLVRAYAWLKFAYATSRQKIDDKGKALFDRIAKDMTPADIEKAETMARRWKPAPTALTQSATNPKPRVEALVGRQASPS